MFNTPPFLIAFFNKELQQINPSSEICVASAKTGAGMDKWISWVEERLQLVTKTSQSHYYWPGSRGKGKCFIKNRVGRYKGAGFIGR